MNKKIFIFGGVFVSLCMLFLVHGVKSSDKNKEKYFISIEKHSNGNSVNMTIKKNDKTTVVATSRLEKKKNLITNDKFKNVYSLHDNDIAEILSNSECEFLDENNKKVEDKSLLAIGTIEVIHNSILRFFFSWILKDEQYVIYCDYANGQNAEGLFNGSKATGIEILNCGNNVTDTSYMFQNCTSLTELDLSKWNTDHVNNMYVMFNNCFTEKQPSTLICKASTIKQIIAPIYNVCLTIPDKVKDKIEDNKIYKFSVERKGGKNDGNCPEIKGIIEEIREDNKKEFKTYNDDKGQETNGENKIFNANEEKKYSFIKDVAISKDGKIDDIQIVNKEFANVKLVNAYKYTGNSSQDYEEAKDKFLESITPTGQTYLSAYVEVGYNYKVTLRCFIHCTNANSKQVGDIFYGLFQGSKATKIEILSCGNNITDMSRMFYECSSLTELDLSALKTDKVTNMSNMFYNCSSLTNLDLSNLNTNNVTDMSYMFADCRSLTNIKFPNNLNTNKVKDMSFMFFSCSKLTNLDLSSFNTINVTNMQDMFYDCSGLKELNLSKFNTKKVTKMYGMFYNCFTEEQPSTLICQASTIKKITDKEDKNYSYLKFVNNGVKNDIENNNNPEQVYKCSVKRVGKNPQITEVE